MADYVAAHITMGGRVPRQLVPQLCQTIGTQGIGREWGEWDFCPETAAELLNARLEIDGAQVLRLFGDEVPYGNFEVLQGFLMDHKLPFDRWHEAKYEISCERLSYRPNLGLRSFLTNHQEEIVIAADPLMPLPAMVRQVQRLLDRGARHGAQQLLQQCQALLAEHLPIAIPALPSLEIVRASR